VNKIRSKMSINVFAALSFERKAAAPSDVMMGGNKTVYLAEDNQHALHLAEDMRRKGGRRRCSGDYGLESNHHWSKTLGGED
jgi:hypothetical protein